MPKVEQLRGRGEMSVLNARIPVELHEWLRRYADKKNTSVNAAVALAVELMQHSSDVK